MGRNFLGSDVSELSEVRKLFGGIPLQEGSDPPTHKHIMCFMVFSVPRGGKLGLIMIKPNG